MRDRLISLRRAINNGWYDDEKQGAINLFLGHFQPRLGQSDLWDLDSDHYLHSGKLSFPLLRLSAAGTGVIKLHPVLKLTSQHVWDWGL